MLQSICRMLPPHYQSITTRSHIFGMMRKIAPTFILSRQGIGVVNSMKRMQLHFRPCTSSGSMLAIGGGLTPWPYQLRPFSLLAVRALCRSSDCPSTGRCNQKWQRDRPRSLDCLHCLTIATGRCPSADRCSQSSKGAGQDLQSVCVLSPLLLVDGWTKAAARLPKGYLPQMATDATGLDVQGQLIR